MHFLKRSLTEEEFSAIDWETLGIKPRLIPPRQWNWAVDTARKLLCTQLVSDTSEMREGLYRYLLLIEGNPVTFEVDAFSSRTVNDKALVNASFFGSGLKASEVSAIERIASEAHSALSYSGEFLVFKKKS